MKARVLLVALLVAGSIPFASAEASPQVATCQGSVGPGIPPPARVPSGIPGFHASWFGQSGYPTLCPGERSTATVAYYNSGSLGWVKGKMGEVAYLGTWGPEPGQDQISPLGGESLGWPRYNRIAVQPASYVGPGQVAWFQFAVQAPIKPGFYKLYLRPLIEGATWMEDYGVFWQFWVLNPDGTYPPPPPLAGCREWPAELSVELTGLSLVSPLCLLPYEERPAYPICQSPYDGCYHARTETQRNNIVWVLHQPSQLYGQEIHTLAHEICHAHQDAAVGRAGWVSLWGESTSEGTEFQAAWQTFRTDPNYASANSAWGDRGKDFENGANVCAGWYYPWGDHRTASYPPLAAWAQKWLPK